MTSPPAPRPRAARRLNQPFRKHARTGLPLVTLKMAMSLDGQTATATGDSPWISGHESRDLVHRWRAESDAIAVGIGTVLADDPLLTARIDGRPPTPPRHLRLPGPPAARLPAARRPSTRPRPRRHRPRRASRPHQRPQGRRRRDHRRHRHRRSALDELGRREITSLFLEGGRTLASAFLSADQIDESRTFIAPMLLGRQPNSGPRAGGERSSRTRPAAGAPAGTGPARQTPCGRQPNVGDDTLITATLQGVVRCSRD